MPSGLTSSGFREVVLARGMSRMGLGADPVLQLLPTAGVVSTDSVLLVPLLLHFGEVGKRSDEQGKTDTESSIARC